VSARTTSQEEDRCEQELSDEERASDRARRELASLERPHPGAAGSLREALAETLTVARLGVPPTLARTLRSTNASESMIEIGRDHSAKVKRWRDGQMALRWCAAGMLEAKKQFRRVNGYLHLPALRRAPTLTSAGLSDPPNTIKPTTRWPHSHHRAATEVPRSAGHPLRARQRVSGVCQCQRGLCRIWLLGGQGRRQSRRRRLACGRRLRRRPRPATLDVFAGMDTKIHAPLRTWAGDSPEDATDPGVEAAARPAPRWHRPPRGPARA
jgi:hypothetical protein